MKPNSIHFFATTYYAVQSGFMYLLSVSDEAFKLISCLQGGSSFWVCGWNPIVSRQMKAAERYFLVALIIIKLYKVALTQSDSVDRANPKVWPFKLNSVL